MHHELEETNGDFTLRARIASHEYCDSFSVFVDRAYLQLQLVVIVTRLREGYEGQIIEIGPERRPRTVHMTALSSAVPVYAEVVRRLPDPLRTPARSWLDGLHAEYGLFLPRSEEVS